LVDGQRNSQGRFDLLEDVLGVEPMHTTAPLDSKGMDAAIARGPC